MNIFGIGGAELVLIILIMLVVAGPQRMLRWAYHLGRYTAILRKQWSQMMDVVQQEINAAGLDVQVPRDLPTRQNVSKFIQDAAKPLSDPVERTVKEVTQPVKEAMQEVERAGKDANTELRNASRQMNDVGSWNQSQQKPHSATPSSAALTPNRTPDEAGEEAEFGAWSNPSHPGHEAQQERLS